MSTLRVNPLPTPSGDAGTPVLQKEWEGGFVDEAVIAAMLARPYVKRSAPQPEDMALSAEDLDFAGWSAPVAPVRETPAPPEPVAISVPRAAPLPAAEPEEARPRQGNLLWWLAGTALALSAILFFSVLPSFLSGPVVPTVEKGTPPGQAKAVSATTFPAQDTSNGEGGAPQP
ncbi:hypothetical protein JIN84_18170 [Luteolibacter yonseiensis]|uniref:Transmembrane protein n=1 Tax=Luteolibacter yonseiensis TaxID=1144680 RepID=A0A934VD13_9BACT|nr:hypothetical protein [Luteolibacter yonseiensis]MBK1817551.1 hypothetical protein [Luteolibacter yonseiensis]